jgi:GT2 family glycosyltransferase
MADPGNRSDVRVDATVVAGERQAAPAPLALAFATIERPQVAQRLIASARRYFPAMPIYVADQSLDVAAMASFYEQMNVTLIRMPYDAGVCASRNRLVENLSEEYFVLCDDDFVFGARTDFAEALRILHHCPEIGVIGGKLYDYDGNVEYTRHWEMFLHLDTVNRTLTSTPIFNYAPRAREMGATQFYMCDAVMNFAVMRRAIFAQPAIRWDERFKSNGEHEDFFLNLKLNSSVRVAYLPTMVAFHHHPEAFIAYRSRLRERLEGWKQLFAKWNIDQHLEVGLGVRSIDDFDAVVAAEAARDRFFFNDDLSLRRHEETAALLVGHGTSLRAVGSLDRAGEPDASAPPMTRLLVRPSDGRVMPGPDFESPSREARRHQADALETPQSRYCFEPPGSVLYTGNIGATILFRYNPVARLDADFVLWYRVVSAAETERMSEPGTIAIHLRWFADDGRVLVWESSRHLLYLGRTDYWVPLLVEAPVCPNGRAFMRFEVVAGESGPQRLLAAGFLFERKSVGSAAMRDVPPPALDAIALTPWVVPEADTPPPSANLDELLCSLHDTGLTPEFCAQAPALMLLPFSSLADLETAFLFGWHGLGAPISVVQAHGASGTEKFAPLYVALPRQAAHALRIVAFTKNQGYCEVPFHLESDIISIPTA